MKAARLWLGFTLAVAALVIAIAWAWTRRTEHALAALTVQRGNLLAEMRELRSQVRAAQEEVPPPAAVLAPGVAAVSSAAQADAEPTVPYRIDARAGEFLFPEWLREDPKLQVLFLASMRATVATDYGPLFRTLGLPSDQVERFAAAKIKYEADKLDLESAMASERLAGNSDDAIRLREAVESARQRREAELLGPDAYAELQRYERVRPARSLAAKYAGAMALAGAPLSREQAEQLANIIARASPEPEGPARDPLAKTDWAVVDAHAAEMLSPAQLRIFTRAEPPGSGRSRWEQEHNAIWAALDERAHPESRSGVAKPPGG